MIFPKTLFENVRSHLLRDEKEQLCIVLCGINKTETGLKFLCREVIKAGPEDLNKSSRVYVEVTGEFWQSALRKSREQGYSILVCHSHPFSRDSVGFSSIDLDNAELNYEYVSRKLPDVFIGSLVFGQFDVYGIFWDKEKKEISIIPEIRVIGRNVGIITPYHASPALDSELYHRQALLFGIDGQVRIWGTSAAVVGCGGLGSITAELLARLGVGNLVLVDDDVLEQANLNRVIGSNPKQVGTPKVEVLKAHLDTFSEMRVQGQQVEALNKSVLDVSVLERLKAVDVIFSGTDTQSSRMVLNELSVKYYIPYIDLAFGIFPGKKIEGYGQVRVVLPDSFCLNCIDGIDYARADEELMSDDDIQMRRAAGYIEGVPVANPSVISLDCVTASLGVTEFVNLVCWVRPVNCYVLYDMQSDNKIVTNVITKKDESCILCGEDGEQGTGDLAPVKNYLDKSVPDNIPTITR